MTIFENVPQDTIKFEVTFETGLTLDTIRMSVPVHYTRIDAHTDSNVMMAKVKAALKSFIGSADWNFSDIRRSSGQDNIERVSLLATARVKTGEDENLKIRIDAINTPGLTLGIPTVDYTFPLPYLNENRTKLRKAIAQAAQSECQALSEALHKTYRLAEIRFETSDQWDRKEAASAYHMSSSNRGQTRTASPASEGGSTVHSEKMFMTAEVTLAVVVPIAAPSNGKKDK